MPEKVAHKVNTTMHHPCEAQVYSYWILLCHSQPPNTTVLFYLLLPQKD